MRAIIIVLDSVGIGALPDAASFGDHDVDTLGHIYKKVPNIKIPNLVDMGIGNLITGFPKRSEIIGNFGKMAEISAGKDTSTGHWEIMGLKTEVPFKTYPEGFPKEFIEEFQKRIGTEVLGNYPASGTEIIQDLGPEHEATGKPIVYTSADSVFQIAMNVDLFGLDTLYRYCEIAREMLVGDWACCRVIARPYTVTEISHPGQVEIKRVRTADRKDYSVSPGGDTLLNKIVQSGKKVIGIGKISDIFNGSGITESIHTESNLDGINKTIEVINSRANDCLIFTNLVDFDAKYGHRRDVEGYAKALEEFDEKLPEILRAMHANDVLFITADHGNDPTAPGTDHTREYVPLIVYGKLLKNGVDLGTRETFADVAATVADILEVENTGLGTSFIKNIRRKNMRFNMVDIIQKKRDNQDLTKDEIDFWIEEYVNGNIPDYQVSALLMAIYLNGFTREETFHLTNAMRNSGDIMDLSAINGIKVDKHSTGGVGDKTTIALAPIVAACGVPVAKMSGRGLGFSGGTIDKLESIPGFKTVLSPDEFVKQVNDIGVAVIGQTADIATADKKLYALRDVTATVDNFGLIASSIMSKKLASGANAIVLDVKCGSGAFMKNLADAKHLAQIMVGLGHTAGVPTAALITNMDQPLGKAVGNSLEVFEAIETLKGRGPEDFTELVKGLASVMLYLGGVAETEKYGYEMAERAIESGAALEKMKEWIEAQGGNPAVVDDYSLLPKAKYVAKIAAHKSGWVENINAEQIGMAVRAAGAGRFTKNDEIDLAAGVMFEKKVGDYVEEGERLCTLCGNDRDKVVKAVAMIKQAFSISDAEVTKPALVKDVIGL